MLPDPAKLAAVCLAAYALAFADQDARKQTTPNQKQAILQALDLINDRISLIARDSQFQVEAFRNSISPIRDHTRWLTGAAESWRPQTAEEGQNLRASLQRIQAALATIDAVTPRTLNLIRAIEDDLEIKVDFCRALGLSTNARGDRVHQTGRFERGEGSGSLVYREVPGRGCRGRAAPFQLVQQSCDGAGGARPLRVLVQEPTGAQDGRKGRTMPVPAAGSCSLSAGPDIQNRPACPVRNLRNWLLAGVFALVVAGSVAVAPGNPWFQALFHGVWSPPSPSRFRVSRVR